MAIPLPRRRSPLAARLCEQDAVFVPFGEDSSLVETLQAKSPSDKSRKADKASNDKALLLCDLSPLTRIGVKGQGTESLLERSAVVAPKLTNESVVQKDGSLCVRLAGSEVLLLSALDSKGTRDFVDLRKNLASRRTPAGKRAFSVPYQDSLCWLALAGDKASDLLATMCAVDLRDGIFARGSLAQTSLARLSALVLRDPAQRKGGPKSVTKSVTKSVPLFHLLADSASSLYLWDCLLDAMSVSAVEHGGAACGRKDLLRFLASPPSKKRQRPL